MPIFADGKRLVTSIEDPARTNERWLSPVAHSSRPGNKSLSLASDAHQVRFRAAFANSTIEIVAEIGHWIQCLKLDNAVEWGGSIAPKERDAMAVGRRQRLSAEETSERLIAAGLDALTRQGMSVGLDAVNLEQAVRDAEVPRSSAYAIWSTDELYPPQVCFQRAVLRRAADERTRSIEQLKQTSTELIEKHAGSMTSRQLLMELIRVGGGENIEALSETLGWQLMIATRAILQSAPATYDQDLTDWINDSEEEVRLSTIEEVYRPFVALLGLEPRPEFGERAYHYGEITAASLAEGLAMRHGLRASEYLGGIVHPELGDEENPWTLYSLMFEQLLRLFFQPVGGVSWDDW